MSGTTTSPAAVSFRPTDRFLLGIVLAVVTFWLFAQTLLNVIPGIQGELGVPTTLANLAVSITSLFSGIFIVVAGKLADRLGRMRLLRTGIYLSIAGSLVIALTPEELGALTSTMLLGGRILQGLSTACIMPASLALLKAYYDGRERQRALSFFSLGTWGGSGLCSLFGGMMAATALGWRSIFWLSIIVAVASLLLVSGTPESRAGTGPGGRFDWPGMIGFVVALLALNVYISQGPTLGWTSPVALGLLVVTAVAAVAFFRIETSRGQAFINLQLFRDRAFAGAVLSNFLLNTAAGTLIVVLGLVQMASGWSSLQAGTLTIGYLVAILATIRVGERLLQRFGPRRPMIWGSLITGTGVLLCSMTFLLLEQYVVLTVIGFTLFGTGLGFYATPSLDTAMASVPQSEGGAAGGMYKMASSLGNAMGVAVSAALYAAGRGVDPAVIQSWGVFIGNQDNVALRFGGAIGLLFNVFMVGVALVSILLTIPRERQEPQRVAAVQAATGTGRGDVPPPPIGN
ncbi:MFS transporter [Citricoccus sp. SGAir0253]|uniref:MFS transporter n=1 Tax=Citricoccus sp. SGAir0253 TaxID=2567881 RepID=UPI0010CD3A73|nr:MFS transporter [Citricoccus sp. SGAir0253]QCU78309.1 MFS transporter [Citricoccus sp. SGAir0253]